MNGGWEAGRWEQKKGKEGELGLVWKMKSKIFNLKRKKDYIWKKEKENSNQHIVVFISLFWKPELQKNGSYEHATSHLLISFELL